MMFNFSYETKTKTPERFSRKAKQLFEELTEEEKLDLI